MADWFCSSVGYTAVTAWAASTAYSVGDIRRPTAAAVGSERVFRCTTAGTSGGTEPTWVNTKAATTNDNTVVWTEITGNSTYNSPTNYAAPHMRLRNLAAWMAAGDDGYCASDHSDTEVAATITATFPGTQTSPNRLFSVNKTTGAIEKGAASASSHTVSSNFIINGSVYFNGFVFSSNNTGGANPNLYFNQTENNQTYDNCDFIITATGSAGVVVFGVASPSGIYNTRLINPRFKFGATTQNIEVHGRLFVNGGSVIAGSSAAANVFETITSRTGFNLEVDGFDFSNLGAGVNLVAGGAVVQTGYAQFTNCKMPASWTGALVSAAITKAGFSASANNVVSASGINYMQRYDDVFGSVREETTIVMTGGATDGTTPFSRKMATASNAGFPGKVLYSPYIFKWNELTGSAKTLTVEIIHDSVTNLKDNEVWLEVEYLGTVNFPLALFNNDAPATVLTAGVDQAASTQAWTTTGLTNPNKQKLEVTVTPQMKGDFIARVCMAVASKTLFYNPDIVVT